MASRFARCRQRLECKYMVRTHMTDLGVSMPRLLLIADARRDEPPRVAALLLCTGDQGDQL